jgi:hypothetical protein
MNHDYYDIDDFNSDRLDYLYDIHMDFFEWLDEQMAQEFPDDWDLLDEPYDEELAMMDACAEELLLDFLGKL